MDASGSSHSESASNSAPPGDPTLAGLHGIEADFSDRGAWIERRLHLLLPPRAAGSGVLRGLYFPKLIEAQNGGAVTQIRVFAGAVEIHSARLQRHGPFELTFVVPAQTGDVPATLSVVADRWFVPAQIGEGNDQRELSWRALYLMVGDTLLLDCKRPFNFFVGVAERPGMGGDHDVQFHLDAPATGTHLEQSDSFVVSGWAFDRLRLKEVVVRVWVDDHGHRTRAVSRPDVAHAFDLQESLPMTTGFTVRVNPTDGLLRLRIDVLHESGMWVTHQRGWVIAAAGMQHRAPTGALTLASQILPSALRSRLQDRKRVQRGSVGHARLPDTCYFHLDAPLTDRLNVVRHECVVSGWVLDAEGATSLAVRVVTRDKELPADAKPREDVQRTFEHIGGLPLYTGFSRVVKLPIGLFQLRVDVRRPDGAWVPMRQARVLCLPAFFKRGAKAPQLTFRAYRKLEREYRRKNLHETLRHIDLMLHKPRFVILISAGGSGRDLKETIRSLKTQVYGHLEIRLLTGAVGGNWPARFDGVAQHTGASLGANEGDFLVQLRPGQTLVPEALYAFAAALNARPDLDLIYGDETTAPVQGNEPYPFYKPAWSPDYVETFDYIGAARCVRATLAAECIDDIQSSHRYDTTLRVTERTSRILHLPRILGHDPFRLGDGSSADPDDPARDRAALQGRLRRTGRQGAVTEQAAHGGCYRIETSPTATPLVSIVIPTAGKTIKINERSIDLIVNVVRQIREADYRQIEIVVVDNGDLAPHQVSQLEQARCRLVTYREPIFNISKKLNLGVTLTRGELLLLMNDDIEVVEPGWIGRMVQHFEKPHVGVVGAKLLYPDGKLQHAGVVHNTGNPDHVRRLFPRDDRGYFFSTCGVRNYGAVTGACMMTPATVYRAVGGYTEALAVSYNDADYCLKVAELGRSVVYAPEVELIHMESQSRVASADRDEVLWYQLRWAPDIVSDPFYSERFLTVAPPTYVPCVNERLV